MAGLMRNGGCPGGARVELLDRRHGDDVRAQIIISTIAAASQPRGQPIDEALRPRTEPVARRDEGEGFGIEIARQCIDLIGIEDRIGPHDPALLIDELTRTFVGIDLLRIGFVEDRKLRLLTGTDLPAEALCLPIGHPVAGPIAALLGGQP
ncbi:hypothetical protein FHS51_003878 [Sphingobium wenxiniae]|uniref:Uncharacterized protein n=1 Tax=Sphingobium wenxiniae (strain DSM 21828 / CGMCC 1.7748 / JZ-1) TaxID=595605 RepID=A0A562K8B2_SPHWJ|nr:hypothetical protein [Sphingobium wenxiniae]TWH91632.1 hypothetical protein IQ35_03145 [Sphingobium wenxiniae]